MITPTRHLTDEAEQTAVRGLVERYGETVSHRAAEGVRQVAEAWRREDGDEADFLAFVDARFVGDETRRAALLERVEQGEHAIQGHLLEVHRALTRFQDVEDFVDPGIDDLLARFSPAPDLAEAWYRGQLAFVILLNFPRTTLARKLEIGHTWTPDDWRAARAADRVPRRLPRELDDRARAIHHEATVFMNGFYIPVGAVVDHEGSHPFPADRKLLAHWLVRDELRGFYGNADGLPRQRLLAGVMGRHVDGTIPKKVMEGSATSWCPVTNRVDGDDQPETIGPRRYEIWHSLFGLAREYDAHFPDYPRHIERALERGNELPVDQVEHLLRDLLGSEPRAALTSEMSRRLGRPLEAFDIYYRDLRPQESAEGFDDAVRKRFPDFDAFQRQLPEILGELGFADETARFLARWIVVEPSRGNGHASAAGLPEYPSFLRTNRVDGRMDWPGLGCSMHELGHCVEQVFGLHRSPSPALRGIPCLAATEAMAFTFQSFAHDVAGLPRPDQHRQHETLSTFLNACEIAGPSLVDLLCWRWLYDHPDAGPRDLMEATLAITDEVWDTYYAGHFGPDENHLLAAYQHMIGMMLYLPNYTVGHVIAHQVSRQLTGKNFAEEVERMCSLGRLTPDQWLQDAVGEGLSAEPLIRDAGQALATLHS